MPLTEPHAGSLPSGSAWEWADESEGEGYPPTFETIVWNGYSPAVGEYSAVSAKWSLDKEKQLLHLERVSVRNPYQPWNETLTNPAAHISVRHAGMARAVAREHFGMKKFKSRTRFYPQ